MTVTDEVVTRALAAADPAQIDAVTFRQVMGSVCTPVAVVTAMDGERPHGTTVSAFMSLSLDPPMVLVALDQSSDLLRIVRRTRRFGVNILACGQESLALTFARKGHDKFDDVAWVEECGVPRLPDAGGWLGCHATKLVRGGDHTLALGLVIAAGSIDAAPLTYHQRAFGTHAAPPVAYP